MITLHEIPTEILPYRFVGPTPQLLARADTDVSGVISLHDYIPAPLIRGNTLDEICATLPDFYRVGLANFHAYYHRSAYIVLHDRDVIGAAFSDIENVYGGGLHMWGEEGIRFWSTDSRDNTFSSDIVSAYAVPVE